VFMHRQSRAGRPDSAARETWEWGYIVGSDGSAGPQQVVCQDRPPNGHLECPIEPSFPPVVRGL